MFYLFIKRIWSFVNLFNKFLLIDWLCLFLVFKVFLVNLLIIFIISAKSWTFFREIFLQIWSNGLLVLSCLSKSTCNSFLALILINLWPNSISLLSWQNFGWLLFYVELRTALGRTKFISIRILSRSSLLLWTTYLNFARRWRTLFFYLFTVHNNSNLFLQSLNLSLEL